MDTQKETARALYERLSGERQIYITRAERCAAMTIPSLFPRQGSTSATKILTPNQSIGARGVNNLASKLLLALLPPSASFFRLRPTDKVSREVDLAANPEALADIEQALEKIERTIVHYIETHQVRPTVKEALLQLVVAGNCLLFLPPHEGGIKMYKLNSYVLQRDALGNVITIVAQDVLSYASAPESVRNLLQPGDHAPDEKIKVYTLVQLDGGQFTSRQECNDMIIDGTQQVYPEGKTPWIPLRLVKVDGEAYGRSYVEEYIGDLENLDAHSEAMRNLAACTGHILYLINPQGITQPRKIAEAKSGDCVPGRPEDVQVLQTNKGNDLQVSLQYVQSLERTLGYAFLLQSAVQRQAERVTAAEIRQVAGELEDALGGTYSVLSQEFQLPLVRRLMAQLETTGDLPALPEGLVEPLITTGIEALGRGHDLEKLMTFSEIINSNPAWAGYLKPEFIKRIATSLGIDTEGLIKSEQEIQQEQQQAQLAQFAQNNPEMAAQMMQQ